MTDQMVQAARSGVRNISEGSGMAATSRKSEIKLTNVARASLNDELLRDFESFLRQRGLRIWPKDSPEALAMRTRLAQDHAKILPPARPGVVRLTGMFGLAEFIKKAEPELSANAMLCAVNQAAYLLKRQIQSQGKAFLKQGGFTEKLYGARKRTLSDPSTSQPNPSALTAASPWSAAQHAKEKKPGNNFGAAPAILTARALGQQTLDTSRAIAILCQRTVRPIRCR